MGGDEFAVLIPVQSTMKREVIADRLLGALARPCEIGDYRIPISAGVGVAHWPTDANSVSGLLEVADHALYAAKGIQILPKSTTLGGAPRVRSIQAA